MEVKMQNCRHSNHSKYSTQPARLHCLLCILPVHVTVHQLCGDDNRVRYWKCSRAVIFWKCSVYKRLISRC